MCNKSVLLLAAESGDGQFRRLLDRKLKDKFICDKLNCVEAFITDIDPDEINMFDVVVVLRSPLPGHPKDDSHVWRSLLPCLTTYVKNGGSLIIMFSESYGKTIGTLNELGHIFDIHFVFNHLEESTPARNDALSNMPEGKLITCNLVTDNPFGIDYDKLDLIVDGGHGAQHLTCLAGEDWNTLIQGSATCVSKPFPNGHYANSGDKNISSPVLAAWRKFGKGSVLAFPGAAPFWLSNACLRRWRNKILTQHNNAGYDFLIKILSYTSTNNSSKTVAHEEHPLLKQQDYSYRYVNTEELSEIKEMKPYRTWIGVCDDLTYSQKLNEKGYDVGIFIFDYNQLDPDKWHKLISLCKDISGDDFLALPAFEQADAEGNYCVVFNVDDLPEMRSSYPHSNMLSDLLVKLCSYSAVFARQSECRIPPWRHGGYNLLEVSSKDDLAVYRDRISSCTFLSALQIDRGNAKYDNWVLAPSLKDVPAGIRENRHFNFISSGPKIKHFFWESETIMLDDWEGYWLEWEEGNTARIEIELEADTDITEVNLWDGCEIIKSWNPQNKIFSKLVKLELKYDLRLHLTAKDAKGGELIASYPLYTRNRHFWAHTGSDQMNDYHNVWTPDPDGSIGVGDCIYETCGFVTNGFAWGDYLRIAPPVNWGDIMPQGVEVSSMVSNLQSFHPSVFLAKEDSFEFMNNHRRKLGKCSQDLHILHSFSDGSWLEQPGALWQDKIKPTRNIMKSELLRVDSKYHIPRWEAGKTCEVKVYMRIEWLREFSFAPGGTISLGHSLNFMKDGIAFQAGERPVSADEFLETGLAKEIPPLKEWDNGGLVELLKKRINLKFEIPLNSSGGTTRDAMGDFLFRPVSCPGKVYMRGWKHNPGFVLSFELVPDQKIVNPGDIMDIEYIIAVTPGEFIK